MACLATFKTTSMALMFERLCKSEGIEARIAPVPRKLSSSCGLACEISSLNLEDEKIKRLKELAASQKIEVGGYYD